MRKLSLFLFLIASFVWISSAGAFSFSDPLVEAADSGDKEQLLKLLQEGKSPDSIADFGVTALMRAVYKGHVEIAKILIESGAYINAADIGGETSLHLAAKNGDVNMVKTLLYYDAYIDVVDKEKWTPLMRAVLSDKKEVVDVLIEKGADITMLNSIDESVLVHASLVGKTDIISAILSSDGYEKLSDTQKNNAIETANSKGFVGISDMISKTVQNIKAVVNIDEEKQIVAEKQEEIKLSKIIDKQEMPSNMEKKVEVVSITKDLSDKAIVQNKPKVMAISPVKQEQKIASVDKSITEREIDIKKEEIPVTIKKKADVVSISKDLSDKAIEQNKTQEMEISPVKQEQKIASVDKTKSEIDVEKEENAATIKKKADVVSIPKDLSDKTIVQNKPKAIEISPVKQEQNIASVEKKKNEIDVEKEENSATIKKKPDVVSIPKDLSDKTIVQNKPKVTEINPVKKVIASVDKTKSEMKIEYKQGKNKTVAKISDNKNDNLKSVNVQNAENKYTMQLGSFTTESQAYYIWDNLLKINQDVLSGLEPNISSVERGVDGKGKIKLYRLRAGNYSDINIANAKCEIITSKMFECFVVEAEAKPSSDIATVQNNIDAKDDSIVPPSEKKVEEQGVNSKDLEVPPQMHADISDKVKKDEEIKYNNSESVVSLDNTVPSNLPWLLSAEESSNDMDGNASIQKQTESYPEDVADTNYPVEMPIQTSSSDLSDKYKTNTPEEKEYTVKENKLDVVATPSDNAPSYRPSDRISNEVQQKEVQMLGDVPLEISPEMYQKTTPPIQAEVKGDLPWQTKNIPAAKQEFTYDQERPIKHDKDYDEFYQNVEKKNLDINQISEAILVKDNNRSSVPIQEISGLWLEINAFPNHATANDYADRMFRYDESLKHLETKIIDIDSPYGKQVNLRVGPLDLSKDANDLCLSVTSGGLRCIVSGNPREVSSANNVVPQRQLSNVNRSPDTKIVTYWINLGAFSYSSEAEYYWSFIKEDNIDVLSNIDYLIENPENNSGYQTSAVKLKLGPFNIQARAAQICSILRYRNVSCLVEE